MFRRYVRCVCPIVMEKVNLIDKVECTPRYANLALFGGDHMENILAFNGYRL